MKLFVMCFNPQPDVFLTGTGSNQFTVVTESSA